MVSTPVIHVIAWTTHLPTPKGWKAESAWLVDPQRTPYPRSGHMSTIVRAQIRELSVRYYHYEVKFSTHIAKLVTAVLYLVIYRL